MDDLRRLLSHLDQLLTSSVQRLTTCRGNTTRRRAHRTLSGWLSRAWMLFLALTLSCFAGTLPAWAQQAPPGPPASVTGVLEIVHADDFDNQHGKFFYFLQDLKTSNTYALRGLSHLPEHLQSGAVVTARGTLRGQELTLAAGGEESVDTVVPATTASMGEQTTIVMAVNFQDKALSCSLNNIQDTMFTNPSGASIDGLYQEASFQQTWFTGAVDGPYTINYQSTGDCDYYGWAEAADAAAQADGVNLSQYTRKVYVMPSNSCGWAGLGTVGGNPSRSWIFRCDLKDVFGHELGHNIKMHHAATPSSEYADRSDIMGYGGVGLRQVNGPHKEQNGWLLPERILEVTSSGTYDIAPLEADTFEGTVPQLLKIAKSDSNDYYYLSYRIAVGLDANLSSTYRDRLNIHTYRGSGAVQTYFITSLQDGESFTDAVNGLSITQITHSPDAVTVQVLKDTTCNPTAPTMSMTPNGQSGMAGSTLSYSVSLINRDSGSCAAATWALSSTLPSGWTGNLSPTSLTLVSGASGSATLSVTSPASAAANTYGVSVDAADSSNAGYDAMASATYTVIVDEAPPSAPSGLSATVKRNQIQLVWNAADDDVGISHYVVWRDGVSLGTTTGTSYNDVAISSGATYNYWATAHDAAGKSSAPSNTVTVTAGGKSGGNGKGGGSDKPGGGGGKGRNK